MSHFVDAHRPGTHDRQELPEQFRRDLCDQTERPYLVSPGMRRGSASRIPDAGSQGTQRKFPPAGPVRVRHVRHADPTATADGKCRSDLMQPTDGGGISFLAAMCIHSTEQRRALCNSSRHTFWSHTTPRSIQWPKVFVEILDDNAATLRDELARFAGAGRRTGGRKVRVVTGRSAAPTASDRQRNQQIRAWANANGYEVSERGGCPPRWSPPTRQPNRNHSHRRRESALRGRPLPPDARHDDRKSLGRPLGPAPQPDRDTR